MIPTGTIPQLHIIAVEVSPQSAISGARILVVRNFFSFYCEARQTLVLLNVLDDDASIFIFSRETPLHVTFCHSKPKMDCPEPPHPR